MTGGSTAQKIDIENLKIGTFGVVATNGIVGAGIRVTTRSPFNHAFIYVGNGLIIEALASGAAVSSLSSYIGTSGTSALAVNDLEPLSDEQRQDIRQYAYSLVGTPYGFLDIALLFGHSWLHYDSKLLIKRVEQQKALICSQLVARCYYKGAGVDLGFGRPDALVTPGDLGLRITERLWEQ